MGNKRKAGLDCFTIAGCVKYHIKSVGQFARTDVCADNMGGLEAKSLSYNIKSLLTNI